MYKIIIAISEDGYITDSSGKIPWHIPHDFKWFKMNTFNSNIVMGRKTWDTFLRPLPHRTNIVLSRNKHSYTNQIHSIEEAKRFFEKSDGWIIGGTMAEQFYTKGTFIFLTHVHINVHKGTFLKLPNMKTIWKSTTFNENGYFYTFTINIIL